MSQVDAFKEGKPVWHMHPVVFLISLNNANELIEVDAFLELYEKEHTLFSTGTPLLKIDSKINLKKLIENINYFYSKNENYKPNIYFISYMLATARHETYHFTTGEFFSEKPEVGTKDYFNMYDPVLANTEKRKLRAKNNGNTLEGDGYKYRGRGGVHLTWKNNYQKAKDEFEIDFVADPDLAGDLKYSVPIMVWGMTKGIFTGKSLGDYINTNGVNYKSARYIINGTDQAELISRYATRFQSILEKTSNLKKEF
jgi:hypothetical protein